MPSRAPIVPILAALLAVLFAGCTPPAGPTEMDGAPAVDTPATVSAEQPAGTPAAGDATTQSTSPISGTLMQITIGLPYQPDVQFTPFYVAKAKGYYAAEGLDVKFAYGDESNFIRQLGTDELAAVVASGEQVILARGEGVPVTYVMTWYQRFPVAVFSLDPKIKAPADLVGRTVGLPAESGASYIGWQAFLAANEIDPKSVKTQVVGFMQKDAVVQGRVDAAVGYVANEPVQLASEGKTVSVIEIADSFNLVSNGLVVASKSVDVRKPLVQSLTTATLKGIRDTLDDPDAAFELALKVVPEAGDPAVKANQRQVLQASLKLWDASQIGAINPNDWQRSVEFLLHIGLLRESVTLTGLVDPTFVEAAGVTANR